nr:MAG TPA: hypothetical protein [Bacteriophage sp.]
MWSLDEPNSNNLSAARTLIPKVTYCLACTTRQN